MPYSVFDWDKSTFAEFREKGVDTVLMLVDDEEAQQHSSHDLRSLYKDAGMEVIQFPIIDHDIPPEGAKAGIRKVLEEALDQIKAGRHLVIHCYAGIGRTGMFAALLAQMALDCPPEDSVAWVREYVTGAVETEEQHQYVVNFYNHHK
jgi:protein-tyrosine phosphatase